MVYRQEDVSFRRRGVFNYETCKVFVSNFYYRFYNNSNDINIVVDKIIGGKMRRRKNWKTAGTEKFVGFLIAVVFVLPIYGIFKMLCGKEESDKILGAILLVVGIVIWILLAIAGR